MHAFHAVVQQGHERRIAVEQGQEFEALFRMLGSGADGDHGALGNRRIHIGVGAGQELDFDPAGEHLGGVFIAVGVALGADQVAAGLLGVAAGIVGGFRHGQGGIDVTGQVIFPHLLREGGEFIRGELVQDHVAVFGVRLGDIRGIQIITQQVHGTGIAGDDDAVGHHALRDRRLNQEGIEGIPLHFLGFGEDFAPAVEAQLLHIFHGVAQLAQQGHVDVPGILGGGILKAVDGVNVLFAVRAFHRRGLDQGLRQGGLQIRAELVHIFVQGLKETVLGVGVELIGGPGAGEQHVHLGVAGGQGVGGLFVEVAPGSPDDFQLRADLIGDVLVDFFEHRGVVADVGTVEHDGDGGEIIRLRRRAEGEDQRQGKDQGQKPFH